MSQENVELVRRVYEAFNRRDWEAAFAETHPDFAMTTQRGIDAGTRRSRQEIQSFLQDYAGAFEGSAAEPDEFVENGDRLVAIVTRRSRPKGGDVDIVVRNGHLWTIRDGKIASMKSFPDPQAAIDALGRPD